MYYLARSAAVFSDLKNIPLPAEIQEGEEIKSGRVSQLQLLRCPEELFDWILRNQRN